MSEHTFHDDPQAYELAKQNNTDLAEDDPVKCGCDEFPECTHALYWYQGFKAGAAFRAARTEERAK